MIKIEFTDSRWVCPAHPTAGSIGSAAFGRGDPAWSPSRPTTIVNPRATTWGRPYLTKNRVGNELPTLPERRNSESLILFLDG